MKTAFVAVSAVVIMFLTPTAGVASSNADWAKRCQVEHASLGYRNVGQCVSTYARGGGTVTGPASLTLTYEMTACAAFPQVQCIWSVQGSGLDPGSKVVVGGVDVLHGAEATVGTDGTVNVRGLFMLGDCVNPGFEIHHFVARGVAPGGAAVTSEVVTGDVTQFVPLCA
ncbi:hypothetical protein G7072_10165 [Nocardioides sp. HDW12B]|uniref:hypothetical protein n=1 Tax=Nocardioides sp. HDW12B TaxID=2714939 RepID=UPI00140B49BB|nr:hypothetical protein [Nocardioides sp. HDW12B]QIK66655.1 hypothetical protein G7072_10165 [Nocardioides sp. HDW12B]